MAHPSCQLSGNSPKKTPQSTPSKTGGGPDRSADTVASSPEKSTSLSLDGALTSIPRVSTNPFMQRFGCLRITRLSNLLLSTHC